MKRIVLSLVLVSMFAVSALAQIPVIRESNRQEIGQTVGDSKVTIVYHRPNTKGRKNIFGCTSTDVVPKGGVEYPCLVPYGQVWRTGANDNTTVEFATDVTINGQNLPAGKYGFFAIPDKKEWTLIFNKVNTDWGSFAYKVEQDALRVKVMPMKLKTPRETLMYEFESISGGSTNVILSWEKFAVPFTVNVGDFLGRTVAKHREAVKNAKSDDMQTLNRAAGFVINNKISGSYDEAMGWLNKSIAIRETFANLSTKARLFGEMGNTKDAIETGEKAVQVGKAATPAVDTTNFEKTIAGWKAKK